MRVIAIAVLAASVLGVPALCFQCRAPILPAGPQMRARWHECGVGGPAMSAAAVTKAEFIATCKSGPKNGVGASQQLVHQVKTMSEQLKSPIDDIANSAEVDGVWRLIFTTTNGSSGGKLGPFVGDVDQDIRYEEGRYFNILRLGPVEARLQAHWDVIGKNKWAVTFDDITLAVLGVTVVAKEFGPGRDQTLDTLDSIAAGKDAERSSTNGGFWDLKYADESLRILNAYGTGKEPSKANVFVLEKVVL